MKTVFFKLASAILRQVLFRHSKWSASQGLVHSILFNYWAKFEYLKEKDPDKREDLKALGMGGDSGGEWAKHYDAEPLDFNTKVGELTLSQAHLVFGEIEDILKNAQPGIVVIQIGSSSGREIAYFAGKYPNHIYIGTDIYQEVVDYSSQSHQSENLVFRKISAKNIGELLSEYKKRNVLIFSRGSLNYVQPEHLSPFFAAIRRHGSAKILLSEPVDDMKGNVTSLKGSKWRGNFSYTHNYRYYAEKEGIITVKCEIIKPYPNNPRKASHFSYYGEAK